MTIDTSDLLNSILGSLSRIDYIKPEEVPNIPLYMDQVTTFMDAQLASSTTEKEILQRASSCAGVYLLF